MPQQSSTSAAAAEGGSGKEAGPFKCPTRRFGRTELQMPIITCGGMRMQQTWRPAEGFSMANVTAECQQNFEAIVDRAMELGINHFETARGYGCSEIQYGQALKRHPRGSMIVQTKVRPFADPEEFRATLETSLKNLDVEYIDLFGFHGINKPEHLDWIVREGGCLEVVREYQRAGRIRFIGFSTHGMTPLIVKAIETGIFDYVNLHWHFIGSYTSSASSDDPDSPMGGNLAAVRAARRHDMGVFIISAADKGGMLYRPPRRLADLCAPLSPLAFNDMWLWAQRDPAVHTLVVGAARPSDFDEHVAAARAFAAYEKGLLEQCTTTGGKGGNGEEGSKGSGDVVKDVEARLMAAYAEVWAPLAGWKDDWWVGLPDCYSTPTGIHVSQIVWMWSIVRAWGLHRYAVTQYSKLEPQKDNWDAQLPTEENWVKAPFDWTPGLPYDDSADLAQYLPKARAGKLIEILREAHGWFGKDTQAQALAAAEAEGKGWEDAFDLQPDVPFPERPENMQ